MPRGRSTSLFPFFDENEKQAYRILLCGSKKGFIGWVCQTHEHTVKREKTFKRLTACEHDDERERGKDPRTSCQKDPSDSDLAWDSTLIFNSSRENEPLPTSKKVFRGEVFPSKSSHIFYRIKNSRFCRRWKESYHFLPWSVGSRIKSGLTHTHFFVEEISKPDGFLSAMMIQLAGQELIYLQFRFLHRKIRGITISLFSLSLSLILVVKVVLQSGVQQIRTLAARCKWQGLIKARYKRDESERIENKKEVSFYDASFACLMRARALQNLGAINYAQSLYLSHFSLYETAHTRTHAHAHIKSVLPVWCTNTNEPGASENSLSSVTPPRSDEYLLHVQG